MDFIAFDLSLAAMGAAEGVLLCVGGVVGA